MAAVRSSASNDRRTAIRDGLACTLWHFGNGETGVLLAPTWRVWLPGRLPVFHLPCAVAPRPRMNTQPDDNRAVELIVDGAA
jgi:hypothetical protein